MSNSIKANAIDDLFARNIAITTACGATSFGACNSDKTAACTINPTATPTVWGTTSYCACRDYYFGSLCNDGPFCDSLTDCSENSGKGTCTVRENNGVYTEECNCNQYYYGTNCGYGPICNLGTECGEGKCGVHINSAGQYVQQCDCDNGYFGDTCATNTCAGQTCGGQGTCGNVVVMTAGSATRSDIESFCKCDDSHFGNACQYNEDTFGSANRIL
jgi:hypothetical protein